MDVFVGFVFGFVAGVYLTRVWNRRQPPRISYSLAVRNLRHK